MDEPYEIRSEWFTVRSYDVDPGDRLTLPALCGYMQEAAGIDATRLGAGMRRLGEQGLAWVLHRMRLEVSAPARGGDRVGVATWPRHFGRLVAERDFDVHDAAGRRLALAASRWVVVDLAARRAVRLPESIRSLPVGDRQVPLDGDGGPLPEVETAELERRFEVRRGDLDVVNHVNNTRYFRWFESARIAYFHAMGLGADGPDLDLEVGPILASTSCDFLAPVSYPDEVLVGARVSRVGTTSCTMDYRVVLVDAQERAVARGSAVVVTIDYSTGAKVPIPDALREAIARIEGG